LICVLCIFQRNEAVIEIWLFEDIDVDRVFVVGIIVETELQIETSDIFNHNKRTLLTQQPASRMRDNTTVLLLLLLLERTEIIIKHFHDTFRQIKGDVCRKIA